jgi:hypothetical protein
MFNCKPNARQVWDADTLECERTVLGGGNSFAVNAIGGMTYGLAGVDEETRLFCGDDRCKQWSSGQCWSNTGQMRGVDEETRFFCSDDRCEKWSNTYQTMVKREASTRKPASTHSGNDG